MQAEIFTDIPNKLKTIEVDVEKRIFKVNGVEFGNVCSFFSISCGAKTGYQILLSIDTRVEFASYGMDGQKEN